jgi:hypothetical protein
MIRCVPQTPTLAAEPIGNLRRPARTLARKFPHQNPAISALRAPQLSQNQYFQENFNFPHLSHTSPLELY